MAASVMAVRGAFSRRATRRSAVVSMCHSVAPLSVTTSSHKVRPLAAGLVILSAGGLASTIKCEDTYKATERCSCAHTDADKACMVSAAASATVGIRLEHGGPFGAAVVRDGVIISCSHNMVLYNKDPTCHAEMTAIRAACSALGTHDLSDCHLYTTCEPCPMCWGAIQWSRVSRAYLGVDRHIAAKYGFDDKAFYEEMDAKKGEYAVMKRYGYYKDSSHSLKLERQRSVKNMVQLYDGILRDECEQLFTDPSVNRTYTRRYGHETTREMQHATTRAFPDAGIKRSLTAGGQKKTGLESHEKFMRMACEAARRGAKVGASKEREPFGAVIVKDGVVIAQACNTVHGSRDCTATAEVNAIKAATATLGTYNLEGCELYTIVQPDVMSLGAILWSRMSRVYCGVTQQFAARHGFEEGSTHFQDLFESDKAKRVTEVVEGVSVEECEAVFKEWSDRNGVIY